MKNENILYWHNIFSKHDVPSVIELNQEHIVKNVLIINYNKYDQTIYFLQKQSYQDTVFDCTTIHEMTIKGFVDNFELDKSKKNTIC